MACNPGKSDTYEHGCGEKRRDKADDYTGYVNLVGRRTHAIIEMIQPIRVVGTQTKNQSLGHLAFQRI